MEATQVDSLMTPCKSPLPDLEVPMINAMLGCLSSEHAKLDGHILQLALAATSLAGDSGTLSAKRRALEAWQEVRRELWSHLQIEDGLVFSWGEAHHALSSTLLNNLKADRQNLRELIAALPELAADDSLEPETASVSIAFGPTLLKLAQALDSHIERYDSEILPSILRALFQR